MMKCHLRKAIKQSGRFLTNLGKFSLIIALFTVCGGKDDSNDLLIAEAFVTTIESELPIGTTFGAVSVTNRTGLLLTFELESENPEGAITIDPNSGALSIADAQLFSVDESPIEAFYSVTSADGIASGAPITITVTESDLTQDRTSFITTWRTFAANESITIPTFPGLTYDYDVDWGDNTQSENQTGNATHQYANAGTYEVKISGDFPAIFFNFGSERNKIRTIEQWGNIQWETMQEAFEGCNNLTYNAFDTPDLSNVTSMLRMFSNATQFNGVIGNWDVSNVTNMERMFLSARNFNQSLNNWDVSNVTRMGDMFENARDFNQPLDLWDVSNVTSMFDMFEGASSFNQPIGSWDVSKVTTMFDMFEDAVSFNQPLNDWDVSSVTTMGQMFDNAASFNQPLNNWDVSSVTSMTDMFERARAFNQPIDSWDVSNVTNMFDMFENADAFNQPLNDWDVSRVTSMGQMFNNADAFNQPLNNWDVSRVTNMSQMFRNAFSFNQDVSSWAVGGVTNCSNFNLGGIIPSSNLPNFTNCTP